MDAQKIEAFYPFDPYLLKLSEKYIHSIYNFWSDNED